LRLNNQGNVLLGSTTDDGVNKLQVNGQIIAKGDFGVAGGTGIKLNNINSGGYSEIVIDNDVPLVDGGFVFGYGGTTSGVPNTAYFYQRKNANIIFGTKNINLWIQQK